MEMRLNSDDIARLIRACEMYKDYTGSEYMWDEYDRLEKKLMYYEEENCPEDQVYREPHLQKKSDECAALWREWETLWRKKHQVRQRRDEHGVNAVMNLV